MTMRNRSNFLSAIVAAVLILALTNVAVVPLSAARLPEMEAQRTGGGQASAANTQVVVNGGIVNVTFDLQAPAAQTFEVTLEASQDGGKTYGIRPMTVSGDVGRGVRPGTGKRIVWDAAKDTDNLQLGELRFRVALKLDAAQSPAAAPPRAVSPPATSPGREQLTSRRGNKWLWPGLAMIGGGLAITGMAAAGPLKADHEEVAPCADIGFPPYNEDYCRDLFGTIPNKPLIGAGTAIAVTGALLMFLGSGRASSSIPVVTPLPKGVRISRTIRF